MTTGYIQNKTFTYIDIKNPYAKYE